MADGEMSRQVAQRVAGAGGKEDGGEVEGVVNRARRAQAAAGEEVEIEGDVLADDRAITKEGLEVAGDGGEGGARSDVRRRDPSELLNEGGNARPGST